VNAITMYQITPALCARKSGTNVERQRQPMTSQLEKDLERRTEERLLQICRDTFELFDMAGLQQYQAARCLAMVLLHETARVMATSEANPWEVGKAMAMLVQQEQRRLKAEDAKANATKTTG
jgi:hypothetical protein